MTRWQTILVITLTASLAGCTTFGHKKPKPSVDSLAAAAQGETIVHQSGKPDPVLAKYDRKHWIDIRSEAKSDVARMHATLATGEPDAAEGLARAYLKKHPGHLDALTVLAASLAMQKKYNLAAYYAGLIRKQSPGHPVALNIEGLASMLRPQGRMQDFTEALSLFLEAFESHGDQIAPGLNLGHLQLELGDATAAAATFKEVSSRCKGCVPALMGYGIAVSRVGQTKAAITAFEDVLEKKKDHPSALFHLALVQKNGMKNYKKAEEYLQRLLRRSKTSDIALRERADVVLRQLKGEADPEERTMIADEDEDQPAAIEQGSGTAEDAELLMTTLEGE